MKKNIVIIILTVLVLGLGGYLVYNKALSNNIEEKSEESYDLAIAKNLVKEYIENAYSYPKSKNIFALGLKEDVKMHIAYNKTKDAISIDCANIYSTEEVKENNELIGYCYNATNYKTYDSVNETYKELFGANKELPKRDFNLGFDNFDYKNINNNTFGYVQLSAEAGGIDANEHLYAVKNAKVDNEKLIIEVGYYLIKATDDNLETFYCELNNKTYTDEQVYTPGFEEELINEIMDKVDIYKFTFFKENGVYKLESMIKE